jgi:hypothetical protein
MVFAVVTREGLLCWWDFEGGEEGVDGFVYGLDGSVGGYVVAVLLLDIEVFVWRVRQSDVHLNMSALSS